MNRTLAIAFLGVALIIAGMVRADASGSSATKIGFIDIERTLSETPAGKRASKRFERTRVTKQKEFDSKQKALQAAAAQLNQQRAVLKPEVIERRQAELEKLYVEVQELLYALEKDLASERAKLLSDLMGQASPIIAELAKRRGYSVVLERSSLLWADDALDLTAEVNKRMK
jgi:outer membrane protein